MDEDLVVALRLQEEWDARAAQRAQEPLSLVDASWELEDPTPDLQALFVQFNDRFFWGRLEAVEVKWSVRMTLCAGICSYEGRGGMCSIRLSEPLLKLRPRKDLVETLLHEMIHAYLFVTNNDKDREGHGPEFCKHMHRINSLTGANITVYHTFHDEVDEYRRHWWRCNGPCQHKQPYHGYVRRATNRAPSSHDYWWAEHQKTCGGTFLKIREPENYSKKGKGKTKPGKQPMSAVENKDKPSGGEARPLVPFSGKGYVLGKPGRPPLPKRAVVSRATSGAQDLLAQGYSAAAPRPSSTEVKLEQKGSSRKSPPVVPSVVSAGHQSVLSSYFPRVSVANQKAFRGGSGSPAESGTVSDITKPSVSSGSQRRVLSSKVPLRNLSKVKASASAAAPEEGRASEESTSKRPRVEDKAAFNKFFTKKVQVESGVGGGESSSAVSQSVSSSCGQHRLVSCPVCQDEVLESQINEHLDWCLEGSGVGARS